MKATHPEVAAAARVNPGETLRQARENKQWSLAEVAQKLNLTTLSLSNLEAGAFDKLPGTTFARGYIRAYAKLLGMDQARLVVQFDQFTGTDASGSSVHSLGRIKEPVRLTHNILRFVSFLVVVVVLGGGFAWWKDNSAVHEAEQSAIPSGHVQVDNADGTTQNHSLDGPDPAPGDVVKDDATQNPAAVVSSAPVDTTIVPPPTNGQGSAPLMPGAIAPPAGHSNGVPTTAAATSSVPVAGNSAANAPVNGAKPGPTTANVTAPKPAPAPAIPAVAAVPQPGDGSLQLQFSADCWIQVIDGSNKVIASGLKHSGESLAVSGKPPLKVRLGVAHAAQVTYNGQPVNVASFTSGDTARITLGK